MWVRFLGWEDPREKEMATHSSILAWEIPWTVACQAPLSMEFLRQEYWSGLPFPSQEALPNPGMEPTSPALAGRYQLSQQESPFWFLVTVFSIGLGLPRWLRQERICLQCGRPEFDPWIGKISWRRTWQPTPIFLPGESHEQRILAGYGPWGCRESHKDTHNMQEYTHTHTHIHNMNTQR